MTSSSPSNNTSPTKPPPNHAFLPILSSALGWLFKSSFITDAHDAHATLARHRATTLISHDACSYSQHIPGTSNVTANSLSQDFHNETNTLCTLIHFNFQIAPYFNLFPLPVKANFWLILLMLSSSRPQEWNIQPMSSATWPQD